MNKRADVRRAACDEREGGGRAGGAGGKRATDGRASERKRATDGRASEKGRKRPTPTSNQVVRSDWKIAIAALAEGLGLFSLHSIGSCFWQSGPQLSPKPLKLYTAGKVVFYCIMGAAIVSMQNCRD